MKQEEPALCPAQRRLGALMGIAYGDAMGMPSEMMRRESIRKRFGVIEGLLSSEKGEIKRSLKAGEVTDDTENTQLVVELLWKHGGKVEVEAFVRLLREWAGAEKTASVIGPSTRKALELMEQGVSVTETGKAGSTNGAAMKILPIGLVNPPAPLEALVEQVRLLCLPTHNTNLAISAAAALAAAVSGAVYENASWERMWELALSAARLGDGMGYYVAGANVEHALFRARTYIEEAEAKGYLEDRVLDYVFYDLGTGLSSSETAAAAMALACFSQGDPARCGRLCANVGGDTDTIGAIACGICGAVSGPEGFPEEDIKRIEAVNGLSFRQLAEKLEQALRERKDGACQ